jgi:hypothetical protein
MEPLVAERNWHRVDKAPKGIGPLLLRAGAGLNDLSYVGISGGRRALARGDVEVGPTHYCEIPPSDDGDGKPSS